MQPSERRYAFRFLIPGLAFLLVCVFATLANPSRVEAAPVLLFIYGYLAPIAVYVAAYRLWPVGASLPLSRVIVLLGLLQLLVVAVIDVPRFLSLNDPDQISGTFGTNAYQLVFFLLVFGALLAGIFTFEHRRRIARFVPLLFVALLTTIFLAQYRALIFTTAIAVIFMAVVVGSSRIRGFLIAALAAFAFYATLSYTASAFPVLRLAPTVDILTKNPASLAVERVRALGHVANLYSDNPRYIVSGTGPGTYSSRAWQTFAGFESTSRSNVAGKYISALTGGKTYKTDVSEKYIRPRLQFGREIQGSTAPSTPFSDYGSLLAEVGVFGFLAMTFTYVYALAQAAKILRRVRRRPLLGDPLPALALATTVGFLVLLQMGLLQSWLEVTRITFPTWILLAVVIKEFHSRYRREQEAANAAAV